MIPLNENWSERSALIMEVRSPLPAEGDIRGYGTFISCCLGKYVFIFIPPDTNYIDCILLLMLTSLESHSRLCQG